MAIFALNCILHLPQLFLHQALGSLLTSKYNYPITVLNRFTLLSIVVFRSVRTVKCFVLQTVPAYCLDLGLKMFNQRPYLIRVQNKLMNAVKMLEHFTVMQLHFEYKNTPELITKMNETDRSVRIRRSSVHKKEPLLNIR